MITPAYLHLLPRRDATGAIIAPGADAPQVIETLYATRRRVAGGLQWKMTMRLADGRKIDAVGAVGMHASDVGGLVQALDELGRTIRTLAPPTPATPAPRATA